MFQDVVDRVIKDGFGPVLFADGFRLKADMEFVKKIGKKDKQFLSVLINRVHDQNAVYLQVFAGVIYDDVQVLAAALEGRAPRKGWPTISSNVGNIRQPRNFIQWLIRPETDAMATGLVISRCIREIVFPFWAKLSSLDGLIEACEPGHPYTGLMSNNFMWTRAAVQCMAGNIEKAKELLSSWEQGRPTEVRIEAAIRYINEYVSRKR